jgi:hypothetical protein
MDPTEVDGDRSAIVGSPVLEVNTLNVEMAAHPQGMSQPHEVTISNAGTGLLVWRATPSASWLQLSANQGLALSKQLGGDTSALIIQANLAGLPKGRYVGTITLKVPYGDGNPKTITVTVNARAQSFVPGIIKS